MTLLSFFRVFATIQKALWKARSQVIFSLLWRTAGCRKFNRNGWAWPELHLPAVRP